MFPAIFLIAATLPAAEFVLPPDAVRITESEAQPLELLSQKLSDDGQQLTVVFSARKGSFSVELDFTGTAYKTATFIIRDAKDWASVVYFCNKEARGSAIDLLHLKDVRVSHTGEDCRITFGPRGYKILPPHGTLRYIARPYEPEPAKPASPAKKAD